MFLHCEQILQNTDIFLSGTQFPTVVVASGAHMSASSSYTGLLTAVFIVGSKMVLE